MGYLYISANSGQSSGGHSALRIGDRVYHLQYSFDDKIFHLIREPWENFRFQYSVVQNRKIEFYEYDLDKNGKREFQRKWDEIYLIQKKYIRNIAMLYENSEFFAFLRDSDRIAVEGFGYFTEIKSTSEAQGYVLAESEKLKIQESLIILRSEFKNEMESLEVNDEFLQRDLNLNASDTKFSEFIPPKTLNTYTKKIYSLLRKIKVREWMLDPTLPYLPSFYIQNMDSELAVRSSDKVWISRYKEVLIQELKNCILENSCEDWEELTTLVRFNSLNLTLDNGYFTFPIYKTKSYPHTPEMVLPNWVLENKNKEYMILFSELKKDFEEEYHFANYLNWERFHFKWYRFRNKGYEFGEETLEPNLSGTVLLESITNDSNQKTKILNNDWKNASKLTQIHWEKYQKSVQDIYSYHLILKNCTNELFRYQNIFFPNGYILDKEMGKKINHEFLSFNFIPAIAATRVKGSKLTKQIKIFPSYRNLRLSAENKKGKTSWKENIPTFSEFYQENPLDHSFLFFTDDIIYSRPLYGLGNLTYAVLYTTSGIFTLPWDKGERVSKGGESVFYSLPELIFFNIRKGHFPYITEKDIPKEYYELEAK